MRMMKTKLWRVKKMKSNTVECRFEWVCPECKRGVDRSSVFVHFLFVLLSMALGLPVASVRTTYVSLVYRSTG